MHVQVLSMALTPTLAALGAKFAGMQMEADADDSPSGAGVQDVMEACHVVPRVCCCLWHSSSSASCALI
jgi:hypothetical protein